MMQSSAILAACVACAIVYKPWAAVLASIRQDLTTVSSGSQSVAIRGAQRGALLDRADLDDEAQSSKENNLRSAKHTRYSELDEQHHARSKVHLRSVLASEVGIVHKTEYWGKIQVGTPPKEFSVIFDTGSGNLILPSTRCTSLPCNSHEKYDPPASNTSLQVGRLGLNLEENPDQKKEAAIHFGTGRIHGQFYQDKLCFGRDTACLNANFIGTDYESESPFDECAFDGIMGLGFKDLSMGDGFNMIDDVVSQHSLPHNQFSVYLKDHDTGSEITFGGYKRSQAASDIIWAPVTRESYWQIGIDDVTFNNEKTGLCSNCQVAVDTGTSLLAGPSDVVEQLSARLDVKTDCSNYHSLPLLGFALGDKVLNLMPDDYIDRAGNSVRHVCSLSLMTLDVPPPKGPLFIFGDPFLRRFLTIYDRDGPRVGFAVAKHPGADASKLIATVSGHASSGSRSHSSSHPEADLIKMDSVTVALVDPTEAPEDSALVRLYSDSSLRGAHKSANENPIIDVDGNPIIAVDDENQSGSSISKPLPEKNKKKASKMKTKRSQTGMLQTTEAEEADLVTISLARTSK